MPSLRQVIAIFCADLHFTLEPPPCRRGEKNWLDTQTGYLQQLAELKLRFDCPIICAGDVVDQWNTPLELINRLADAMPMIHSIAGQHDTKHHNLANLNKTAYTTLIKTGRIKNIPQNKLYVPENSGIIIHAFPWGASLHHLFLDTKQKTRTHYHVALIHQYAWRSGSSYPGAPADGNIKTLLKQLKGYDIAVFGDNHISWEHLTGSGCKIFNCGGFMRRRSDEINHKPSVGLLYDNGAIERHYLDISQDVFEPLDEAPKKQEDTAEMKSFLRELSRLGDSNKDEALNFQDSLRRWAADNPGETAQIILEVLEC